MLIEFNEKFLCDRCDSFFNSTFVGYVMVREAFCIMMCKKCYGEMSGKECTDDVEVNIVLVNRG